MTANQPVLGIDTSHYNGDVTVHTLDGSSFGFGQCTVGTWPDPAYAGDQATMRAAHATTGAYHYAVYGPGPTRQAQTFLLHAGTAQLLALDCEARGSNGILQRPATIKAIIINIRRLDPHKRKIGLYSSRGTWPGDMGQDFNWVADYDGDPNRPGVSPRIPWDFWQRSGNGIDRDMWHGTLAQLHALAGGLPA